MRRNFVAGMLVVCLVVATTGCSRSPRVTFYTLEPGAQVETAAVDTAVPTVAVGPVTLPDVVDRPQLVMRVAANRVDILETHRWAEPLKSEIPRLIAENLRSLLGSSRVSSYLQHAGADADYRVLVDIQRFESSPGEAVTVEALWSLRRVAGGAPVTGRSLVREPVGTEGYDLLAAAYGRALLSVSRDLARAIRAEAAVGH
ncbi:MAG: membrane integrity-associated transporter subunit PqiC [Steroidobacteraceae bacterium]|nr:membrane integrity-associated transporter subunit PqiC [Deltaproteobacteria bacterium]